MSRLMSYNFHLSNFFLICFLFIGFLFGIYYWPYRCNTIINQISYPQYSFYQHFQYRTINTCHNENSKIFLTISILSSYERLIIYLPSIIYTWGSLTTNEIEIIIFVEEKSLYNNEEYLEKFFFQLNQKQKIKACLYIVKLKDVENTYPPQKKGFYAMKFLHIFYQNRTLWILRLDDNAYVNIEKLIKWLKSIDHRRALYIGQSGSGRKNGPPIHFPKGKYFCMGGSGVILSQRTLIQLGPWLDKCLNSEIVTKHEDVELGRCILQHLHIGCTSAYDLRTLFYHHYGPDYSFGHDLTPKILSQTLIIHPIKHPNIFLQIFAFYLREKLNFEKNLIEKKRSFQLTNYVTFLTKIEYDLVRDIHVQSIDSRWKFYIQEMIQTYIENFRLIWHKRSSNWTLTHGHFIFGYHRMIPTYGLESIIDLQLNAYLNMKTVSTRKQIRIYQKFLTQHRFDYREIDLIETNDNIYKLNLIVVSYNKDNALKRFIENFQNEVLNNKNRLKYFTLTILYFPENNQINNQLFSFIYQLSIKYTLNIRLSIINEKNITYNRGLGRQLASKLFTNEQILFFLDVDLIFTGQALDNTRRLMIHQLSTLNCTVYFPIIFSFFSNLFINENNLKINFNFNSKYGLFSIYGFEKKDLDRIGGWEINNYDWGDEDVNLFKKFNDHSKECYIFRTVEPGLKHYYHKKMCNGITNVKRQKTCHDADIILLGSQMDMENYLYNHKIVNN